MLSLTALSGKNVLLRTTTKLSCYWVDNYENRVSQIKGQRESNKDLTCYVKREKWYELVRALTRLTEKIKINKLFQGRPVEESQKIRRLDSSEEKLKRRGIRG